MRRMILIAITMIFLTSSFSMTLLLYKGSEGGYGESFFKRYIVPVLEELDEKYKMMDVEKVKLKLDDFDFIVTWYYSPKMENAKNYLRELSSFLMKGGKILIINNIGAIQDEGGDNPTLLDLNSVFNLLGITYRYGWKRIKILDLDLNERYLEVNDPNFTRERDVEDYHTFGEYTETILKVSDGERWYPVAMIGPRGGIILFDYFTDDENRMVFNFHRVIFDILSGMGKKSKVLVLGNENEDVERALELAQIPFEWKRKLPKFLSGYIAIVQIEGRFPIDDPKILDYVENGGGLVLLSDGVKRILVDGLKLDELFPFPKDYKFLIKAEVGVIPPPLNSKPLLTSNGETVSWILKYGKGRMIYFPLKLINKYTRGLFVQILSESREFFIHSILNSYTIFLDDFPLPSYGIMRKKITEEFGDVTDGEFYYNIWWKDMVNLSRKLNIKYTTLLITSYNGRNRWPFDFSEFLQTPYPMRELKNVEEMKFELGLHGYNHKSLTKENWEKENLLESLKYLKAFLRTIMGEEYDPVSYVAPNNVIDEFGVEMLKRIFPSIRVIGTYYFTDKEKTLDEFELRGDTILLPRTTAGYYPIDKLMSDSVSVIMNFGTFQYFLHPDDLFSTDRNPKNKSWEGMVESLEEFLTKLKSLYPWLRNHFGYESADLFIHYFKEIPRITFGKDEIIVKLPEGSHFPRYFFLRSKYPLSIEGGRIIYKYKIGLYVLKMEKKKMAVKIHRR